MLYAVQRFVHMLIYVYHVHWVKDKWNKNESVKCATKLHSHSHTHTHTQREREREREREERAHLIVDVEKALLDLLVDGARGLDEGLLDVLRGLCRGLHEDEAVLARERLALLALHVAPRLEIAAHATHTIAHLTSLLDAYSLVHKRRNR